MPMPTTPSIPVRRLRSLLALAALATAFSAQAVPVNVTLSGLPPGLAPVIDIHRTICPGTQFGWAFNPSQPLTEFSHTVIEPVTLPGGLTTLRSRFVTLYTANFDTPRTPVTVYPNLEVRCTPSFRDVFQFFLRVPGVDSNDDPAHAESVLGVAHQNSTVVTINRTLAARTIRFTPTTSVLTRNAAISLEASYSTDIGTIQGQRLDFLRPSPLGPNAFIRAASLFIRTSDGASCVQAGSITRCLTGSTPVDAGGVRLLSPITTGPTRFLFELLPTFAIGTLKLRATADASDLAGYLVDGAPQALDLLPLTPMEQTVTVQ